MIVLYLSVCVGVGGMTFYEMESQLTDGFTCFLGTNPNDNTEADTCSHAAAIFVAYVIINFCCK